MSPLRGPCADLQNQPLASGILTQPSRYKLAESYLLADGKGPQQGYPGNISLFEEESSRKKFTYLFCTAQ